MDCMRIVFCCCGTAETTMRSGLDDDICCAAPFLDSFSDGKTLPVAVNGIMDLPCFFVAGASSLQHPIKATATSVNADCYITSDICLGVADGVSSIESEGYDPSKLPRELVTRCGALCSSFFTSPATFNLQSADLFSREELYYTPEDLPKHIVARAAAECSEMGSTTLCFAMLRPSPVIGKNESGGVQRSQFSSSGCNVVVANVGDSQMLQLRSKSRQQTNVSLGNSPITTNLHSSGMDSNSPTSDATSSQRTYNPSFEIISRTYPQQHFFNCPYQLTRMPDVDCSYFEVFKRAALTSHVTTHPVEVGDVLILGTDGLFDNLFDEEIVAIVEDCCMRYATQSSNKAMPKRSPVPWMPPSTEQQKQKSQYIGTDIWWLTDVNPTFIARCVVEVAMAVAVPMLMIPSSPLVDSTSYAKQFTNGRPIRPFSASASKSSGRFIEGGKPDDTSVVVAFVQSRC